jgi:membrane fusion protein (multidrug efflux system)
VIIWWWLDRQRFETTDNAFVEADIVLLSPEISGYVTKILVTQNAKVEAGQVIGQIEPADTEIQLQSAIAARDEAKAALSQLDRRRQESKALLAEKAAIVSGSEAERNAAITEKERIAPLAARGWATKKQMVASVADAQKAQASVQQARAGYAAEQARIATLASEGDGLTARLRSAEAVIARSRLDVGRTALRAPVAGTVGPVLTRPGEFVKPGDLVMYIVPGKERYLIANFKESQLRRLRLKQRVRIVLDAFPDREFEGWIESFSPATGSKFTPLPIDNANGNFVKITQRLPVRIAIAPSPDAAQFLRPGLSAKVRVDVRDAR